MQIIWFWKNVCIKWASKTWQFNLILKRDEWRSSPTCWEQKDESWIFGPGFHPDHGALLRCSAWVYCTLYVACQHYCICNVIKYTLVYCPLFEKGEVSQYRMLNNSSWTILRNFTPVSDYVGVGLDKWWLGVTRRWLQMPYVWKIKLHPVHTKPTVSIRIACENKNMTSVGPKCVKHNRWSVCLF